MNVIAEIQRINEKELENGYVGTSASWHAKYASSAWVYLGNLDIKLSEGDIICVMSQFGEVEDMNLVREESTGKSRGFAFLKYEDAKSCVLAVDNFAGTKILGRSIRVDHVENYRLPKHLLEKEEEERQGGGNDVTMTNPGHAYKGKELSNEYNIEKGQDLFAPLPPEQSSNYNKNDINHRDDDDDNDEHNKNMTKEERREAKRKRKEERQAKRHEKEKRRQEKEEAKRERRAKKYLEKSKDNDGRYKYKYGDKYGHRRKSDEDGDTYERRKRSHRDDKSKIDKPELSSSQPTKKHRDG